MMEARTSSLQLFFSFLKLGCISFGGPVAHLGYFQEAYVRKRKWLTEAEYGDLVALCQFLPGPASSQVGFAIGYRRGGVPGAFAAWLGFTMPSALLLIGFALGLSSLGDLRGAGWIAGLKLAAVAVVANAIWNLAAKLCPDRERALVALGSAVILLAGGGGLAANRSHCGRRPVGLDVVAGKSGVEGGGPIRTGVASRVALFGRFRNTSAWAAGGRSPWSGMVDGRGRFLPGWGSGFRWWPRGASAPGFLHGRAGVG